MHLLVRLKTKDEGCTKIFTLTANLILWGCSFECVPLVLLKSHAFHSLNIWANTTAICFHNIICVSKALYSYMNLFTYTFFANNAAMYCTNPHLMFFFSSVIVYSLVFLAHCEPIISTCWKWAGFSLIFPVFFPHLFIFRIVFLCSFRASK